MPRVAIAINNLPAYGGDLDSLTWTGADAANGHDFINDGKSILIARNTNAAGRTATVISVADPLSGRTGDKTLTVAATTGLSIGGSYPTHLFNQAGGKVNVDVSNSHSSNDYQLAVVRLS